jgi:amino acid transporter
MRKNRKSLVALFVSSLGLFYFMREVLADIVAPSSNRGTSISLGTLVVAGIVVLVIAISSYLLLRRIRKSGKKNANK